MIFLQAAARPVGPAAALLELAEIGELELLVSDACIEELREVLTRPSLQRKFPSLTISAVRDFLDRIQACSMYSVNIANVFVLDRDPKDGKYADLAIATKADFLVTRDKDLLDLGANWNRPDELKILVACRGWSRGHVNTRSKKVTAENTLALAA